MGLVPVLLWVWIQLMIFLASLPLYLAALLAVHFPTVQWNKKKFHTMFLKQSINAKKYSYKTINLPHTGDISGVQLVEASVRQHNLTCNSDSTSFSSSDWISTETFRVAAHKWSLMQSHLPPNHQEDEKASLRTRLQISSWCLEWFSLIA